MKLLRQRWIAIVLFILGSLHLLIVQQSYKPNTYVVKPNDGFDELDLDGFIDTPPTKIVVLGERESGADSILEVLRGAFTLSVEHHGHISRRELLNDEELESISSRKDVLWIIAVRSPCEWAEAMISRKKEICVKDNMLQNLSVECDDAGGVSYNFLWNTWPDDNYSQSEVIIPSDIDPKQTKTYKNLFEMRRHNLLITQQIMELVPRHVKIVRLTEFELNPNMLVKDLVKEYRFTLQSDYEESPITASLVTPTLCMDYAKWKEAQGLIDWKLEGYFGHHSMECHLCHKEDDEEGPSIIYLLGERNSGTTFVSDTLAEAFDPPNSMGSNLEKFSSGIPILLHKHMFQHHMLTENDLEEVRKRKDILWVLVVRSPCDWAEGMYRKPYHLCPPKHPEKCGPDSDPTKKIWLNQNSMVGISLHEFVTTFPWVDWAESVPFLRSKSHKEGDEEVSISKPSADYTYKNAFALRKHKLKIMKQIIDAVPLNVKLVRLKEIERSPEKFIQDVSREFKIPIKEGYKPQVPSIVTHSTTCFTPPEWEAAEAEIDWELDGEFGFSPYDCRMCYGYDKSTRYYTRFVESNKVKEMLKNSTKIQQPKNKQTKAQKAQKE